MAAQAFTWLDAPVERVGSEFTPVGFNRILERATLPNTEKVLAEMIRFFSASFRALARGKAKS